MRSRFIGWLPTVGDVGIITSLGNRRMVPGSGSLDRVLMSVRGWGSFFLQYSTYSSFNPRAPFYLHTYVFVSTRHINLLLSN